MYISFILYIVKEAMKSQEKILQVIVCLICSIYSK